MKKLLGLNFENYCIQRFPEVVMKMMLGQYFEMIVSGDSQQSWWSTLRKKDSLANTILSDSINCVIQKVLSVPKLTVIKDDILKPRIVF